tara:strand:+ start:452 stop:754 length:303 start_codon:yes stop_codon:yes gene_type:complete
MRVRVAYAIDLEGVPQKVCSLLSELDLVSLSKLNDLTHTDLLEKGNVPSALARLQEIRDTLVKVDQRAEDCINILIGYQRYLSGAEDPPIEGDDPTDEDL